MYPFIKLDLVPQFLKEPNSRWCVTVSSCKYTAVPQKQQARILDSVFDCVVIGRLLLCPLDRFFKGTEADLPFVQAGDILFPGDLHEVLVGCPDGLGHWPMGAAGFACLAHVVPSHLKRVHYRQLGDLGAEAQVGIGRRRGGLEYRI